MRTSERGRISVDLKQLRPILWSRARAAGVLPSDLVRDALAVALSIWNAPEPEPASPQPKRPVSASTRRVRVTLRIGANEVAGLRAASRVAGLSPGEFVEDLLARVPVLQCGEERRLAVSSLTGSSAELAALSRSLRHLGALLQVGNVQAALEYRETLLTMDGLVQSHLRQASCVLASLSPRRRAKSGVINRRPV